MSCQRCGRCCYSAVVALMIPIMDEAETGRWLYYHRCDPLTMEHEGKKVLGVRIPLSCSQLKYEDGIFHCKIYKDRPGICRDYDCNKAEDGKNI